MSQGDAIFARTNCDWPMDARCRALTPVQKWINHVLWVTAVKVRSSTLPDHFDTKHIAFLADSDIRTVKKAVTKMQQLCLIEITDQGNIKVLGVESNNKKIHWKSGPYEGISLTPNEDHIESFKINGGSATEEEKKEERKKKKGEMDTPTKQENETPPPFSSFELQARQLADLYKTFKNKEIVKGTNNAKKLLQNGASFKEMQSAIENYKYSTRDSDPTFTKRIDKFFNGEYDWRQWLSSPKPQKSPVQVKSDKNAIEIANNEDAKKSARDTYFKEREEKDRADGVIT